MNKKYDENCLNRKVLFPIGVRPVPDGNGTINGKRISPRTMFLSEFNSRNLEELGVVDFTYVYCNPISGELLHDSLVAYSSKPCLLSYLGDLNNQKENYVVDITINKTKAMLWNLSGCFQLSARNYYPTYIAVFV